MSGRKEKVYPEEKIKDIILRFADEYGVNSTIPKRPLSKYAKKLFREGELEWLDQEISDNYWCRNARRGFQIIEDYNRIICSSISEEKDPDIKLPSIKITIQKYYDEPDKLLKVLIPYEIELKKSLEKEQKLKKQITELKEKYIEQKNIATMVEKQLNDARKTICKIFYYSDENINNIPNLISLGSGADKRVQKAFETMFSVDADNYLNEISSYKEDNPDTKVVTLLDDFRKL
jgi:hypothetical protein